MTVRQLPLSCLPTVFGVSAMSIYLWRLGTPTKSALEVPFTPSRLRAWAKSNGREIAKQPEAVLASYEKGVAKKAGRPSRSKPAKRAASFTNARRKTISQLKGFSRAASAS